MAGANYGNTVFEGSLEPLVPIVKPVQDNSQIIAAEGQAMAAEQMSKGWDEISRGIQTSAPFFKAHFAAKDAEAKTGVLSSFQSDMLLIADAVDQGELSVPAARMRMRALNSQYVADNPSLLEDLNNLQAKLTQTAGLADIVTTGNEETQRQNKIIDEAVTGGWRAPGMTDQEAANNYLAAKRSAESLADMKRKFETKQIMRQEITETDKFEATQTLKGFMTNAMPWVQAQTDTARQLLEQGGDPGLILQQLKDNVGQEMAKIGFLKSVGGEQDVNFMLDGVNRMVAAVEDLAKGTTTTEVYKAKIDSIKAQNELAMRSDLELGPLISASELIGNTNPKLIVDISNASARLFGTNATASVVNEDGTITGGKPADIVGQENAITGYLLPLQDSIEKSVSNPTPELNKEVGTHITNLLRGIKSYSASTTDARDFRRVIEFFASPSVGKFAETNKAVIPAGVKSEAIQVIQAQYENVLLPLVRQRYEEAYSATNTTGIASLTEQNDGRDKPATQIIEPYWNGTGVEFRSIAGFENNAAVQDQVKQLNSGQDSVAGPLNTLIRAKAHMDGTTDYKKVYEETLMDRLWADPNAEEVDDGTDIDDLAGGDNIIAFTSEAEASTDRDSYFDAIKSQESGGNPDAKNPGSSATGLYQFLKGTWNTVVNSPEGQAAGLTSGGRTDPEQQEKAIRIFTEWNADILTQNGLKPTNGNLYAMHFLGNAVPVLIAEDAELIKNLVPSNVMKANPFLKGKTVAWFRKWVNKVAT